MTELALEASEEEYYKILDIKLKSVGVTMDSFKIFVDRMVSTTEQAVTDKILHEIDHWKADSDEGSKEVDKLYLHIKALSPREHLQEINK